MWKESIFSTETRLIKKRLGRDQSPPYSDAENQEFISQASETLSRECSAYYRLVHVSENSWLMGELVTSQITLIVLPSCIETLGKKILAGVRKNRWCAIFFPVALPFAIVVFHIMLVFIAASIGRDILMMMVKLFYCPKSKTGSENRPEVSSNIIYRLFSEREFY
jgi:hypothetical protein